MRRGALLPWLAIFAALHAEAAPASSREPEPGRRAAAVGASVVPGVLVHGTGHWVAGRPRAARRLVLLEGIGLAAFFTGGATLVLSGASRYLVGPSAALTMSGFSLFSTSFFADVYGTSVPIDDRGEPARVAPVIETELGYVYVYDPQFSYRNFLVEGVDVRWRSLRIAPRAWFALDDANQRLRLLGSFRAYGPRPHAPAEDGSFFDVEAAVTHHRYGSDGFSTLTGELFAQGRLDLVRLDPDLRGMFGELGTGLAVSAVDYDVPGLDADVETLLLGRFAFGVYVGDVGRRGAEVSAYYDHRHDDFAAGLKLTGLGSGVTGHAGLLGRWYFHPNFGFLADAQVGSAAVLGLSFLYREGATP